jgi:hypothetical protein
MENQIFTLALKQLPFKPDCNQIIYIEGQHDEVVNGLIKRNFHAIRKCFAAKNFDFCYIPYLKHDLVTGERLHYNAPYAKSSREADFMVNDNFILDYMIHPENRGNISPSLLYYHPDCWDYSYLEADSQFRGITITASSFEGDEGLKKVLDEILRDIDNHRGPLIRFSKVSRVEPEEEIESASIAKEPLPGERCEDGDILYRSDEDWDFDEEFLLDKESKALFQEIRERVEKLEQKGVDSYLIEMLFKNRKRKLSRLLVNKNYSIFLPDYFGMEIRMTPLPKAVFLLFLKHPEGIKFSYLPDFRDELLDIYKKIKGAFYNESSAKKSVWAVTDPLNNSINEKCSRIREAFISQFDDHLARFYYVDGEWGEAKRIALPRQLVKWEEE